MTKWEYMTINDMLEYQNGHKGGAQYFDMCPNGLTIFYSNRDDVAESREYKAGTISRVLGKAGADGWELCSVVQLENDQFAETRYFFKRPLAE